MPKFMLNWAIELDDETPLDAARQGRRIQRDPESIAGVFSVTDEAGVTVEVDLQFHEEEARPPFVYKPEFGEVELIIREDYSRPEPAVYITFVPDNGDTTDQEYDDKDAAMNAWPTVDWRAGDEEDGRGVVAVGHYLPEEEDEEDDDEIPADFPVQPLKHGEPAISRATCGHCGLSWDDGKVTSMTPAPSARCPFEAWHDQDEETDGS